MIPGGPDMGQSSVLDRVKLFLPMMAQANEELDKQIKGNGAESVTIDNGLVDSDSSEEDEGDITSNSKDEMDTSTEKLRTVQIDFALGDFDGTPIALAEEEKERLDNESEEDSDEEDATQQQTQSIFLVDKK